MAEQTADLRTLIALALVGLGNTADQVADRLRAKGIKGRPLALDECPIARFVHGLGGIAYAEVTEESVWVMPDEDETTITVELPGSVFAFVRNFDRDVYLDLCEVGS